MRFAKPLPENWAMLDIDASTASKWCSENIDGKWRIRIWPTAEEDVVREVIVFDDPEDMILYRLRWQGEGGEPG
jgi:hypothetical protein